MPATPSKRRSVGVFHCSSPAPAPRVRAGLRRLKELGFDTLLPQDTQRDVSRAESSARRFLAGSDKGKVRSFLKLWRDPQVTTLFAARGGYGTLRLLAILEKLKLGRPPNKTVWGFSDLTCLQNWLYSRTGRPWVHSPMLTSESFRTPGALESRVWKACFEGRADLVHRLKIAHRPHGAPAALSGPLLGGNLACFVSLLGTRWEPVAREPFFFFLEDVSEPGYRIDRWMHQLQGSKLWKKCQGVVLGHFTDCPHALPALRLWARENNVLLLEGLPAGHDKPNVPVTMGKSVSIELQKNGTARVRIPILKFG